MISLYDIRKKYCQLRRRGKTHSHPPGQPKMDMETVLVISDTFPISGCEAKNQQMGFELERYLQILQREKKKEKNRENTGEVKALVTTSSR